MPSFFYVLVPVFEVAQGHLIFPQIAAIILVCSINPMGMSFIFFLIMKKFLPSENQSFPTHVLEITGEHGPDYPLLQLIDNSFSAREPNNIKTTEANSPRKTEAQHGNVDALTASLKDGWNVTCWPLNLYVDENGNEELFDGRHTLKSVKANKYSSVPVALYNRKITEEELYNNLSKHSVLTLSGLFANATDGTINAKTHDFVRAIKEVIEKENLPLTREITEKLAKITGVYSRYSSTGTISGIINSVLNTKIKSIKVFNTTKEEVEHYILNSDKFGKNNYSKSDGVATRSKILDKQFTYRYAGDILKWAFAARGKNENLRVICSSKAEHESQIEEERIEIIECMKEIFLNPVNVYRDMIETQFSQIGLTLPVVSIQDLPLEIWAMPQIQGETEAIQLL